MQFACWITTARIQTYTHNIQYFLLHNWLILSDLVTEKLRNDLYTITVCLAKLYFKEDQEQTNILLLQCSIKIINNIPTTQLFSLVTYICHKSTAVQHLIFFYNWQCHAAQQHTECMVASNNNRKRKMRWS